MNTGSQVGHWPSYRTLLETKQLICRPLWPGSLPDPIPHDHHLWGCLIDSLYKTTHTHTHTHTHTNTERKTLP